MVSNASLLQDHETEVRAATIKDISSFVDLVGPATFASEVMPYVLALLQDVNLVRSVEECQADVTYRGSGFSTCGTQRALTEFVISGPLLGYVSH